MKTEQLVETCTTKTPELASNTFIANVAKAEKMLLEAYAAKEDTARFNEAITYCKSVIQDGDDLMTLWGCFDSSEDAKLLCQVSEQDASSCAVHGQCESLRVLVMFIEVRKSFPWEFNNSEYIYGTHKTAWKHLN